MSSAGHAACVEYMKGFGLPLMLLGGGGERRGDRGLPLLPWLHPPFAKLPVVPAVCAARTGMRCSCCGVSLACTVSVICSKLRGTYVFAGYKIINVARCWALETGAPRLPWLDAIAAVYTCSGQHSRGLRFHTDHDTCLTLLRASGCSLPCPMLTGGFCQLAQGWLPAWTWASSCPRMSTTTTTALVGTCCTAILRCCAVGP
jgi:hypothetical protein